MEATERDDEGGHAVKGLAYRAEIIWDELRAKFEIPYERGGPGQPSILWFCERCSEIVARMRVVDALGRPEPFMAYRKMCKNCPPNAWNVPGSIWTGGEPNLTNSYPIEVLTKEFEVQWANAVKQGKIT